MQSNVVLLVPRPIIEHNVLQGLLACEHGRQQNAVVVGVGLSTKNRHVVHVGRELEQLFQSAHTGHAVANHHQFGFVHGNIL